MAAVLDPHAAKQHPDGGGLTSAEAGERLAEFGPNAIAEARPAEGAALLGKFVGLVPGMLELAVALDLVLGRWVEAGVIFALLLFNAILGFFQERRTQRALALLRQRLTVRARVRRDGRWQVIPATGLVPGDLVHLRAGDVVPADVGLTEGQIQVDESSLTGESLPADRAPEGTAYAGALVKRGEATGVVAATGTRTYFGKTAELVRIASAPPRVDNLIMGLTKDLAALDVLLALAVLLVTVARGTALLPVLPFVLMLLVASVPVALPAMFTMSASLGARGLAEKGVLVTRLSAIEDAAGIDVLCLDKTGTLTENSLIVGDLAPAAATTADELLRLAALASDEATQDPIDLAVLQAAHAHGLLTSLPARVDFVPFDPSTKRSEAAVHENGQTVRVVKGEPATVAELAQADWPVLEQEVARLSADGSRVLAVATGVERDLHLAGLVALGDPPRPDSAALVTNLVSRGVRVLLVTGDGAATARALAAKVRIAGEVAPEGTIHEGFDAAATARFGVFPRCFPADKFLLVKALQKAGHVVGMTGDGVNDAPALRQADVGIAVASATDVAKAAASIVLTKPGLGEIMMAVDGSRMIFRRMQTFMLTMNARKIGIPLFLALGVLVLGAFVLNPLLMVLLMFATDLATMFVSMDRVTPSPGPEHWDIRRLVTTGSGLAGLLLLVSAAVYWVGSNTLRLSGAETQTLVFVWLVFGGAQAVLYLTRARSFFWTKPRPGRWLLLASLFDILAVTLLAGLGWLMAPIPLFLVAGAFVLAVLFLVVGDLVKVGLMHLGTRAPVGDVPRRPSSAA